MGSTKEIQTRMKSIQDTMKITNAVRYRAVLL